MARKKQNPSHRRKKRSLKSKEAGANLARGRRVVYLLICVVSLALGAAAMMVGSYAVGRSGGSERQADTCDPVRRLGVLLSAGADGLAGMDIAEMNLLCAAGLPVRKTGQNYFICMGDKELPALLECLEKKGILMFRPVRDTLGECLDRYDLLTRG